YDKKYPHAVANTHKTIARSLFENEINKTKSVRDNSNLIDSLAVEQLVGTLEQVVDVNNYSFETAALLNTFADNDEFDENGRVKKTRTIRYLPTFYTNYLVTQVDFNFLNNSYQSFTGNAFYFYPGFNLIFKIGTADLFENYRITAGARLSANLSGNEYLLSFENLKKRWNKQLVLHRQVMTNNSDNYYVHKVFTHEAFYIMRYPFSQVHALQITGNFRHNYFTYLSLDNQSLLSEPWNDFWFSLKAEYIFDNTSKLSTNILSGTRVKVFGEAFRQLNKKETDMFVVGCDFRYYQPIYKNLIFAARFASSYSFGNAKLIYYLGGIDNWIRFSKKNPIFDSSIRIDPDVNYVYQAVATNMRGFQQNVRNGTNFAVVNAEIRWPVFSYFFSKPINNDFLKNFQIVGFFDVGSAWSGLSPFDGDNAYQNNYYDHNSISVVIYNNNYPIVAGYGFGLRTKLFGYFIRADWAWGLENGEILSPIFYLSLGLDF
ncbi:hypothetical protein LJC11_03360, partial [Bacteroidales bacterium OttesenSCG-928-I21]|nr:hypothetical protein [Bacteroidales bacterium OttesenSCG-928-I21]